VKPGENRMALKAELHYVQTENSVFVPAALAAHCKVSADAKQRYGDRSTCVREACQQTRHVEGHIWNQREHSSFVGN